MKKFNMENIDIKADNMIVYDAFTKGKMPKSPSSQYHLLKIKEFLTKENLKFSVSYVRSKENKADSFSRATTGFTKSLWIRFRESQEKLRNRNVQKVYPFTRTTI
eukprot:GHVP01070848.1.p1 GENE.GHVP01070848.1~~GHVP01070848.1.p1  ORF type:complete len:105 (-),score=10.58 GHVP01070848.1:36-350(-)